MRPLRRCSAGHATTMAMPGPTGDVGGAASDVRCSERIGTGRGDCRTGLGLTRQSAASVGSSPGPGPISSSSPGWRRPSRWRGRRRSAGRGEGRRVRLGPGAPPRPPRRSGFHSPTRVVRGRRRSRAPDSPQHARPNVNGGASPRPAAVCRPYHARGAYVVDHWAVRRPTTHPVRRWRRGRGKRGAEEGPPRPVRPPAGPSTDPARAHGQATRIDTRRAPPLPSLARAWTTSSFIEARHDRFRSLDRGTGRAGRTEQR